MNNYADLQHYGEWISSDMLEWMSKGEGELTKDNYTDYIESLLHYYLNFDYNTLSDQWDDPDL